MKRRRFLGVQLNANTGRLYHGRGLDAQDELESITRRQAMRVLESAPPDKPPREWALVIAAVCIGVSLVGLILGLILAIVWPQ